eukprot:Sspe_Gene.5542::Locus_1829_Transcript_1_1_Confidence_1.000_Length_2317::g.5542::m.5542
MDTSEKRVTVAVRVRPKLPIGSGSRVQQEEYQHPNCCTMVDECTLRLSEQRKDQNCKENQFTFDYVFDMDCQQSEVYEEAVQELVDASLAGINSTILAYGQTGSGKTHTVLGQVQNNPLADELLTPQSGLFLRILKDLFEYKRRREDKAWVVVGLSAIEIYLDTVRDLLSSTPKESVKVLMTDDQVKMDLTRMEILTLSGVYKHFKEAQRHRTTRSTEANDESSRSHCLFFIDILQQERTDKNPTPPSLSTLSGPTKGGTQTPPPSQRFVSPATSPKNGRRSQSPLPPHSDSGPGSEPPIMHSRIVLADLAGSERSGGKAGSGAVHGTQMHKEMLKINQSLTALGNVVHALHEGQSHIPYRDSMLTRVLRPSFAAPSSKVLLISNLSPSQLTYDESYSTLQFANKVKAMKVANAVISAEQQQLQFDFLETQKVLWALQADLHICNLINETGPVVRKFSDVITNPYKLHRLKGRGDAKERARVLKSLEQAAKQEKARVAEMIEARKKQEHEEMLAAKIEMRESEIDHFKNEVEAKQAKIKELMDAANEYHTKLNEEIEAKKRDAETLQAECEKMERENQSTTDQLKAGKVEDAQLSEEKTRLIEEKKKRASEKDAAQVQREMQFQDADRIYAQSAWKHCKAQQFVLKLRAYRDTQLAFYNAQKVNFLRMDLATREAKKLEKLVTFSSASSPTTAAAAPAAPAAPAK